MSEVGSERQMHNLSNREPIQFAVVAFVILGISATVKFIKEHKERWAYAVPPLTWLAHLIIFYVCVFLRENIGLLNWNRLHLMVSNHPFTGSNSHCWCNGNVSI